MKKAMALGAALAGLWIAGTAVAELPTDEPGVVAPPPVGPHWVFLTDATFFHMTEGKILVVDADQLKTVGLFTTGYLANGLLSKDGQEYYVAETFYSRGTRGERTDVVTIFDMKSFAPVAEVRIPGRFLVVTQPFNMRLSPDGRFLYVFNMTPATSVVVVDVKNRALVGEISTPGCAMVLPGKDKFIMPCGDGTFLEVSLDGEGKEVSRRRTESAVFDPDIDPISERPAVTDKGYVFISYAGQVYEVDLSGPQPKYLEPWSLTSAADGTEGWRPGGWMHATYSPGTGELFVAMHQGGPGTHEAPGPEIWVYDLAQKKRARVITPPEPVLSIAASRDDQPILAAITETLGLAIMDARSGAQKGSMTGLLEIGFVLDTP